MGSSNQLLKRTGRGAFETYELLLGFCRLGRQHDNGNFERLQLVDL